MVEPPAAPDSDGPFSAIGVALILAVVVIMIVVAVSNCPGDYAGSPAPTAAETARKIEHDKNELTIYTVSIENLTEAGLIRSGAWQSGYVWVDVRQWRLMGYEDRISAVTCFSGYRRGRFGKQEVEVMTLPGGTVVARFDVDGGATLSP